MNMKIEKALRAVATLAGGLVCLCGCSSTVNTVERAQPVGQRQMVDDKRILTDASLDQRARIMAVNEAMTPGGLLQVQVELLNQRRSLRRITYQFQWFDANGMQVNSPMSAAVISLSLEGKESVLISGVAPTPACKDFRLRLMQGK